MPKNPKTDVGFVRRALALWVTRVLNLHNVITWPAAVPWYGGPIQESFTGAWQHNVVAAPPSTLLSFSAIYACVTGIASDIAKMRIKLMMYDGGPGGIGTEIIERSPYLPVLRKPNSFQNQIEFIEQWLVSKLLWGNTYVLKRRDNRGGPENGIVREMYVLHPNCVKALVAENGDVYYDISRDDLSDVKDRTVVPASEIIHDKMVGLWHPLLGVSPLYACSSSGMLGSTIQGSATTFFGNKNMPGGHLSAPGAISDETAARLKASFEAAFSGTNAGKLLVTGDGLKFEPFGFTAKDAEQLGQLQWTVLDAARAFRYPPWKLGEPMPPYTKPDIAQTAYLQDCLHPYINKIEKCLTEGLELPSDQSAELDIDELLRMDQGSLYEVIVKGAPFLKLDEQRFMANKPPIPKAGKSVWKQHQDYPAEILAERGVPSATPDTSAQGAPKQLPAEAETQPQPQRSLSATDVDFFESELQEEDVFA